MKQKPLPASSPNPAIVERLLEAYRTDPKSVPAEWQELFRSIDGNGHGGLAPGSNGDKAPVATAPAEGAVLQERLDQLVHAYRVRGHLVAKIDPLQLERPAWRELEPEFHGIREEDLDRHISSDSVSGSPLRSPREVLARLRNTYCRSIGVEFMHIDDPEVRGWLQQRMESTENHLELSESEQLRILSFLTRAVVFEESIRKRFIGAKTFSLEGCESLIPLLDLAIERAGMNGVREIVMAMAHRGRLNVLNNIMGKPPADIFRDFDGPDETASFGSGDVKYHLGHSTDWQTAAGANVHISLCFNPSHLEFINPVAVGRVRAKQTRAADAHRKLGLALLIHGDAAFAGEGIVQETLNLSQLYGYTVGGAVHVVVNNQIGFTTCPSEGSSSPYATGVARMLKIPIFHVNGEDPEAVAQVTRLALDFQHKFHLDVVIDMYGYRRFGHNETDEPSFTQPLLYQAIRRRQSVREGYLEHLLKLGKITREAADEMERLFAESLEEALAEPPSDADATQISGGGIWVGYRGGAEPNRPIRTGFAKERLLELLTSLNALPDGFHRHPRMERMVHRREQMITGDAPLDWAAAEALAFATLLAEGVPIRLTGQDSARGTFSHRHAVLHDYESGQQYTPLQHIAPQQAEFEVHNSPLSEAGVLGFEYGYSLDAPESLVLWEAQYGDFANAAQVIIDQFISSAEDKWRRLSGLVLLLPHGYEGRGPEHSSARIERFLNLVAKDNMQIAQPTTPAQLFHLLRRQALSDWRKPLVIFTPKSLLRHPDVISDLDELADGSFKRVLFDEQVNPRDVSRILLCSGRVYFDLVAAREELKRPDVAIVRLEQLYPLRFDELEDALWDYSEDTPVIWVQDEPKNMGAWRFLRYHFGDRLLSRYPFLGVYRAESSSPATGSSAAHKREQEELIARAFGLAATRSPASGDAKAPSDSAPSEENSDDENHSAPSDQPPQIESGDVESASNAVHTDGDVPEDANSGEGSNSGGFETQA